jgi:hypothetical protein
LQVEQLFASVIEQHQEHMASAQHQEPDTSTASPTPARVITKAEKKVRTL